MTRETRTTTTTVGRREEKMETIIRSQYSTVEERDTMSRSENEKERCEQPTEDLTFNTGLIELNRRSPWHRGIFKESVLRASGITRLR